MTTPATPILDALKARILSNTLTESQQTILADALDEIAPTFPSPDELANGIAPTEQALARAWMATLYAIVANGDSGGTVTTVGVIIQPNIAALSAVDVTNLPDGQPARVQSNGSKWELTEKGTLIANGITVATSTDAARVWQRSGSFITEEASGQTAWYVDSSNVSTHASDENTGLDAEHPLLTKNEINRRWGTSSPELDGIDVVITYLSNDASEGNDVGVFTPIFKNAATLRHTAALPAPSFSGTLLAVTAKSVSGNQALASTFTTTSGALAVGMLLVNTNRGNSLAHALRDSDGTWLISQPVMPTDDAAYALPVAVDTWANDDQIQGYELITCDLGTIGGQFPGINFVAGGQHIVEFLDVVDTSETGFGTLVLGAGNTVFHDLTISRYVYGQGLVASAFQSSIINMYMSTLYAWYAPTNSPVFEFYGGAVSPIGCCFMNLGVASLGVQAGELQDAVIVGEMYIDTGTTLNATGRVVFQSNARVYGQGTLDLEQVQSRYSGDPTVVFPITNLKMEGSTNAYSYATTAGSTAVHLVALTAANLKAAAGAAGFGGVAYAGASQIGNGTTP